MPIVSLVALTPGTAAVWDRPMHERLRVAERRPGWIASQLLQPVDKPHDRVIVGTWESREQWAAWHTDATFRETRQRLDGLQARPAQEWWHQVVEAHPVSA
jgi:heme-degrading monooxygenase HmoA